MTGALTTELAPLQRDSTGRVALAQGWGHGVSPVLVTTLCVVVLYFTFFLPEHGVEGHGMHQPSGEWKRGLLTDLDFELKFQVIPQSGFHELKGFFTV